MKFSEIGVTRALRVYSAIADSLGVDGPKRDKPITEDRVYRHVKELEKHRHECRLGRCPHYLRELNALRIQEEEERMNLLAIGAISVEMGHGSGHIVDGIRGMALRLKWYVERYPGPNEVEKGGGG